MTRRNLQNTSKERERNSSPSQTRIMGGEKRQETKAPYFHQHVDLQKLTYPVISAVFSWQKRGTRGRGGGGGGALGLILRPGNAAGPAPSLGAERRAEEQRTAWQGGEDSRGRGDGGGGGVGGVEVAELDEGLGEEAPVPYQEGRGGHFLQPVECDSRVERRIKTETIPPLILYAPAWLVA